MVRRPLIGVGVVILGHSEHSDPTNPWEEVVLIQRGKPPRVGEWSIPGGKQEWGESIRDAAKREAREETGLEIELLGLIDVLDLITPSAADEGHHFTLIDFAARVTGGTLTAGSDAADAQWVPLDAAIERVQWSETKRILQQAQSFRPHLDSSLLL